MRILTRLAAGSLVFAASVSLALPIPKVPEKVPEPTASTSSSADEAYDRGLTLLTQGKLDDAEQAFQESLKRRPGLAKAMLGLAEVAFKRNKLQDAGRWIDQAVKAEPNNGHVQASLGRYLYLERQYERSETALKKAISLNPSAVRPHVDLGDLYLMARNKPAEAAKAYKRVIALDPQHAGAHYALGNALGRLGDNQGAEKELTTADGLDPKNPLPSLALARLYVSGGNVDKAMERVDHALVLQPGLVDAIMLRGDLLTTRGENEKALAEYMKLVAAQPKLAGAHLKVGMLQQGLGRKGEAKDAYLTAIKLKPDLALAYNNLAWLGAESGNELEQALDWAKKAVQLAPDAFNVHDTLGWVFRAMGRLGEAETALAKAAAMKGATAEVLYHLGLVYQERKKTKDAEAAYRKALALQKDYAPAQQALAKLER